MEIVFERSSVCAGDDVFSPNARLVTFATRPRLSDVLTENGPLLEYLPCVHASRTYWKASIGEETIATISFTCEPFRSISVKLLVTDRHIEGGHVFFEVAGQERIS